MPDKAPSFCVVPGCAVLTARRRCAAHAVVAEGARRNVDVRRWYRTARWLSLRARVLVDQAYQCADCRTLTVVLEVDHIRRHGGDPAAFWDRANLQALCPSCHARKTLRGE